MILQNSLFLCISLDLFQDEGISLALFGLQSQKTKALDGGACLVGVIVVCLLGVFHIKFQQGYILILGASVAQSSQLLHVHSDLGSRFYLGYDIQFSFWILQCFG